MKISVLMENNPAAPGYHGEHGLSLYMETAKHRILADTGQTALTWENADRLGVDLKAIDTVIISHGHYDHAGGLLSFAAVNPDAAIYMQRSASGDFYHGERYIGIDRQILELPNLHLLEGDHVIDEELSVFTGITGRRLWPSGNRLLTERISARDAKGCREQSDSDVQDSFECEQCREVQDSFECGQCREVQDTFGCEQYYEVQDSFGHEQCLVVQSEGKTMLLSGCAHNGILNILDRFRELYGTDPDIVVSGFHMMKKDEYTSEEIRDIEETARELAGYRTMFYTGHCTGQAAFDLMKPLMPENLRQIHAGDILIEENRRR